MRSCLRLALLAFACLLPACATDDSDADPGGLGPIHGPWIGICGGDTLDSPELERVALPDWTAHADLEPDALDRGAIAAEAAGDVCACTTNECVTAWIEDHLGCGLCAHMVCDGGTVGGCVPCDDDGDDTGAEPAAKKACVLPGSLTTKEMPQDRVSGD